MCDSMVTMRILLWEMWVRYNGRSEVLVGDRKDFIEMATSKQDLKEKENVVSGHDKRRHGLCLGNNYFSIVKNQAVFGQGYGVK